MHSLLNRLEALERRSPGHLVLTVTIDGETKEVSVTEYETLPEPRPRVEHVSGGNLAEFDRMLDAMLGPTADICNL